MSTVNGTVQKVQERWESNAGKKFRSPLYNLLVNGDWYGCGFNNPNVVEGDFITFNAEPNAYNGYDADVDSIEKGAKQEVPAAKQADTPYVDNRQLSIVYQSQHRDAITAVSFLVENEILALPKTKAKAYDAFLGYVEELTAKWTKEALNPELDKVAEEVPEDE